MRDSPVDTTPLHRHAVLSATSVAAVLALLLVGTQFAGFVVAGDGNGSSNVTVSVAETISVTLEPDLYNFSGVGVGTTNFSESNDALQMIITNDGSVNVTDLYAHPDTVASEDDNPLGTGDAQQYAAGRFLWIKNDTSGWYHASAMSWNITENAGGEPSGINDVSGDVQATGFYRNATGDYLWQLESSDGFCNSTSTDTPQLYIKTNADTGSNRDMQASDVNTIDLSQDNADWAAQSPGGDAGTFSNMEPLTDHYVAAHHTCEFFTAYRFDEGGNSANLPVFNTGAGNANQHLIQQDLAPGDTFTGRVGVSLPLGIPTGDTNRTLITIHAERG